MKAVDALTDNSGQVWRLSYESKFVQKLDPYGQPMEDENGRPVFVEQIVSLQYRKQGGGSQWLELPPWAMPTPDFMIDLCWFDEDEETGELEFWNVGPLPAETVS